MTAPERIWLQDGGDFDAASEVTWCQHSIDDADTEYIRADLATVQPAQVRVKPLVWEEGKFSHQDMFYAETEFGPWLVVCYSGRGFRWTSTDTGGDNSENDWDTADAAKAEAQADYEARILAALEPQPDPRDEVIARLVEAVELADAALAGANMNMKIVRRKVEAALAAAKAVQHG